MAELSELFLADKIHFAGNALPSRQYYVHKELYLLFYFEQ